MKNKNHVALYGRIKILRAYCDKCKIMALVVNKKKQCCGRDFRGDPPKRSKRMTETEGPRKGPGQRNAKEILEKQDGRCFYCNRLIRSYVTRKGILVKLEIEWDHVIPYSYLQSSHPSGFVAACHICNGLKSDFIFRTLEEAQIYLYDAWGRKGYL